MARVRASDFEDKQRFILESAAAVFAEMGMEKASMAQIATRAKVSKPNLYHYYRSKEALIFDIINTHLLELDASVAAADDPTMEPSVRLHRIILSVLKSYRDADDYHKVQLNALYALSEPQRDEIRALERRIVDRFYDVIRLLKSQSGQQGPAAPSSGHHVALRHTQLGLHVVPRRRPCHTRRLRANCYDLDAGRCQSHSLNRPATPAARLYPLRSVQLTARTSPPSSGRRISRRRGRPGWSPCNPTALRHGRRKSAG